MFLRSVKIHGVDLQYQNDTHVQVVSATIADTSRNYKLLTLAGSNMCRSLPPRPSGPNGGFPCVRKRNGRTKKRFKIKCHPLLWDLILRETLFAALVVENEVAYQAYWSVRNQLEGRCCSSTDKWCVAPYFHDLVPFPYVAPSTIQTPVTHFRGRVTVNHHHDIPRRLIADTSRQHP